MEKINFDDLYLSASSGNKESYRKLYSWFQSFGFTVAYKYATSKAIYYFNKEDLSFYIAEIFLLAIRSFGMGKVPFNRYAEYLLKKRIPRILNDMASELSERPISLDATNEEGLAIVDTLESDDYRETLTTIDISDNRYKIASQNRDRGEMNGRIRKLMRLRQAGYSKKDICKQLNLSDGQYRYLKRRLNKLVSRPIEMK